MTTKRWDVLGLGIVTIDDLIYVDHFPAPDTKVQVRDIRRESGGQVATGLVAAARLGATTAYCSVLGKDDLSRYVLDELAREGVDCTPVIRRPGAGPIRAVIIVDANAGERTVLYSPAGEMQPGPAEIGEELVAACRVLFVDQHAGEGGMHALELAQALGIPSVGDLENVDRPGSFEMLRRVDHLIIGAAAAGELTGKSEPAGMVRALAGPGRACCVVTDGERGCWFAERGGPARHFPAYPVPVADTTGCGDVFHGAYAAWLAHGAGVEVAIRVASAAAALKATQPGGRAGIPDRATVERFLAEREC
jgi:sulfofructose kinase